MRGGQLHRPAGLPHSGGKTIDVVAELAGLNTPGDDTPKRRGRSRVPGADILGANDHVRRQNAPGLGISSAQWQQILEDAKGACAYCGKQAKLTKDHVVPIVLGGRNDVDNIVAACKSCNSSKSSTPLHIWKPDSPLVTDTTLERKRPVQFVTSVPTRGVTREKKQPACRCLSCTTKTWTCKACGVSHCRHVPKNSDGCCPCRGFPLWRDSSA